MKTRLGIIDWGIGGVSIYKLIRQKLGTVPITYFSDTGAAAYGKMSRTQLLSRLELVIEYLVGLGVTHVVIGCNAASTVIPKVRSRLPIVGVIEPAARLIGRLRPTNLGTIGGRRTILSGVYRRAFASRGIRVKQRVAQPLSGMIESGDTSSIALHDAARRILAPLSDCSHILLACTHYPAIRDVLQQYVSSGTRLVDPAGEVVRSVGKWRLTGNGADQFLTTGDASAMRRASEKAFGQAIPNARKVNIRN